MKTGSRGANAMGAVTGGLGAHHIARQRGGVPDLQRSHAAAALRQGREISLDQGRAGDLRQGGRPADHQALSVCGDPGHIGCLGYVDKALRADLSLFEFHHQIRASRHDHALAPGPGQQLYGLPG